MKNLEIGSKIFSIFNYIFLSILSITCLMPILNILAISFSNGSNAMAGDVTFWPVNFTFASFDILLKKKEFLNAFWISSERVIIGVPVNMILTILAAYPLSRSDRSFRQRKFFVWFFYITMLFSGGLIPTFMVVRYTNLIDSIWSLIIPTAVPIWNIILLMNFFRDIPKEIDESAHMDGASHIRILFDIYLPISTPALATLTLFSVMFHWNSWFDGMIYMNSPDNYPLQTLLQKYVNGSLINTLITTNKITDVMLISQKSVRAAMVFVTALPMLIVYPFCQKYFTKGLVLGSVKG